MSNPLRKAFRRYTQFFGWILKHSIEYVIYLLAFGFAILMGFIVFHEDVEAWRKVLGVLLGFFGSGLILKLGVEIGDMVDDN